MRKNTFSRMMAIGLSAVLTFTNVDLRVFAEIGEDGSRKTITNIQEIDEEIARQTLYIGASEEDIIFPDTLDVTVTYQEEIETKKKIEKDEEIEPAGDASTEATTEEIDEDLPEDIDPDADPEQNPEITPDPGSPEPGTPDPENPEPDVPEVEPEPEPASEPAPEQTSEPADNASEESGEGLIGMIFPAIKAYAASDEADLGKSEEPEEPKTEPEADPENKDSEPEEEQYEIVKEIVTITEDITIENVKWELDKENSSFDKFSSDEAGAEFVYVPAISDLYEVEALLPTITVKILKEEVPLEYMVLEAEGVRVEGNLPVGSTLQVTPIDISEAESLLDDPDKVVLFALDVCIMLDGEEIEPDESVKVTVTPPADIETEVLENDTFELVHFPDESSKEIVDTQVNDQGELEFEMDSFSPLVGTALRAAGDYDAEFAAGKSFSQNVRVNFQNAALITGNVSYVKLKLWGNISGSAVKLEDGTFATVPFVVAETEEILISAIIEDADGNTSAHTSYSFSNIPVYVEKGTGHSSEGGNGTYQIPQNFYGIQIETAEGYSPQQGAMGSDSYYKSTPVKDINDPVWTTSQITIENSMLDVVNPDFIVNWQDNRNYADMRPYTSDTSIDDHIADIQNSISLYYKSGSEYVSVAENPSILVSTASLKPEVVGGPFSWTISYKKLPKFVSGETPYEWYIKLSDSFYDGKKSYYQLAGLNGDGYLKIVEGGTDALTLTFTNSVTGSVNWRVGDVATTEIPALPDGTLYSDDHTTMTLYKKVGSDPAKLVGTSEYSIAWTESTDRRTWEYSITGLPLYAANGDAILYYTVMVSDESAAYKYTYDNGLDSTETDKCLPGQKIYATSIGDAVFSFDKVWYDDNDQNSIDRRKLAISKNITFYLWRYPSNGTLADGAPVTYNAKQYSYKLTAEAGDSQSVKIGLQDFATAMGAENVAFPKYDEQGYKYIYYVTEVSGSELYKTVYWNSEGEFSGTSSDKAVLNGGKICNVRSGQIAPEVTKQWNVSAISDYVGSVCTFKLQRKEGSTWVDVDGADLTLSGFSSSKKKVTGVFGTQELYNLLGKRYEYRVIESSVKAGSGETVNLDSSEWTEEAGGFSNLYTLKDYSYKAVTTYTTTVEGGKESAKATVINKLYGTKKLSITKNWTGAWNIGKDGDLTGDITIDLRRAVDGGVASLYATIKLFKPDESGDKVFTIDYVDTEQEDYTGTYTISDNGVTWKTQDVDVIAYTEEGQQYVYSIYERSVNTQAEHYGAEYDKSVGGKRIDLTVTNRIGGTNHRTRIDIQKVWKDDSDSSQRSNIDVYLGTYDEDGNFTQVYYEEDNEQKPYKLTLTSGRDYDWYIWVDGNDFIPQGSSETPEQAIANHLSIKPVDAFDRTIEERTFQDSPKSLSGGVVRAIAENGVYKPGYRVSISRNASGTSFTITNTRVASRAFTFTKNWEDSANALGLRGNFLRVALFREVNDTEQEVAFIDIPTENSTSSVTVTFDNGGQYYPAYDSNGNNYIYSVKEYICQQGTPKEVETLCPDGVEPDADTVVKTEVSISATKDTTTTGYVVERTVSDTEYSPITGTYDLLTPNVQSMLMTDSYTYTNRAAGQRSDVQFYVVWHDNAKSTERPDVYLTLYYDGGENGAVIPFTGSYTERWEDVEAGNKFVQKAVFSGLPAADDSGRVYTYYVTEHFNNATTTYETEHYSIPLFNADGTFNSDAVEQKTIGAIHQLVVKDGVPESDVVVDGHKLTKEESFTLTSISDTVKIEGRKLWLGIPEGIEVGHLPGAYIYLFRDSATDHTHQLPDVPANKTQQEKMDAYSDACVDPIENQDEDDPKYVLLNSTKSMYVFGTYNTDGTVATYTEFPKYDDLGYLYKYTVREVIYNEYKHELPADIMIPNYSDNTTDLSNQYKLDEATNKRDLVVHKQWNITRSPFQTVEAKATFRLYRRELGSDGHEYKALHYAENDMNIEDPASSRKAATMFDLSSSELEFLDEETITSNKTEIRWDNYQIFAPSGKLYAYYAVEVTGDMPGYTVSLNGADSTCTEAAGSGPAANNNMIEGGSMAAGDKYIGVAFANSGIDMSKDPSENVTSETFRNTYVPTGFNKITFKKKWEAKKADQSTWTEMLPNINDSVEPLTFSVYCIAKMQSSDKDNYDRINFKATDYTVTKALDTNDTTGATWDYTITFNNDAIVPIYSANGNLYTYYVAETLNSDFVKANYAPGISYTYKAASDANTTSSVLDMSSRVLTNSLKGSFGVQKIWDDFSNDYGMREGGITFDVYYRLGTTDDFTKYNSSSYTLNSSNKWATTISGLPVTSNSSGSIGSYYQYRIIETGIKDSDSSTITVSPPATDDQTTKWIQNKTGVEDSGNYFASVTAGNYQVYNPADITSIATSTTRKLVNQLDTSRAVVSLKVTKNWEDEGDAYGLRPTSITISIQSSVDHGQTWTEVVTRSLTSGDATAADANTWEKVFENLPKFFGTGDNDKYMYRAVETHVGSAACTMTDASNLAGIGGAYGFVHDITGDADNGFAVTITNTLRRMDKSVKIVKRWNTDAAGTPVDVALFSTNYATGIAGTGTPTEITQTGRRTLNASSNWECTYSSLPKYNKDGRAIRYYVKEITTGNFKTQYLSASGSTAPLETATDDLQFVSSETDADFWVVVVNTPLTKITGTKIWSDENNKYKLRPASVVLTLQRKIANGDWENVTADELKKTNASASPVVTVNEAGSWKATIDKLPLYALSDGSSPVKYQYRLAELSIPNAYTRNIEKAVTDLTPEDGYEYGGADEAQTSTVTNHLITRGEITVNKVWNTNSEADKHNVNVKLYSKNLVNGTGTGANADVPGATATLSGSNLSKTFTGLPAVNKDGNEIVYYVEETADTSYDTAYYVQDGTGFAKVEKANAKSSGTGTFEFKIVNTPLTQITGRKVWEDDSDGFGLRPAELTLTLQRRIGSGEWADVTAEELHTTNSTASPTVDVNATGSWEATIDKLPLYVLSDGANPAKYQYRFAELSVPDAYEKTVSAGTDAEGYEYGGTDTAQTSKVTNSLVLRENAITVEKIWNTDTESQKKSVVVKLLSRNFKTGTDDGTSALSVVEKNSTKYIINLNAGVNWKAVIEGLPLKNTSGEFIVYYISETTVDGAATEYYLYNGTDFEKVQEQQVKSDAEKALLTKIINTPYTTASVEKVWSDDSNKFGTRPNSTYVKLQRKATTEENWADVAGQAVIELNEANSWSASVENLPLYVEYAAGVDPVRYEYRFLETNAGGTPFVPLGYSLVSADAEYTQTNDGTEAGYVTTYESDAYKTVITNTLITKSITAVKIWDDNSDSQKIRPAEITLFVDAGYVKYDNAPITNKNLNVTPTKSSDGNTWTYVFTGLPKYAYGTGASAVNPAEIVYTITEDVDYEYESGFIIKNYYQTTYGVDEIATTITNTAMESDGVLLVEKKIEKRTDSETVTTYAFPFKVSFTRLDNTVAPYTGKYYLYDASIGDEDLRTDAKATESAYERIELSSADGTIRIPSGKVAALVGINTMYRYTVTENPNHAGYEVKEITVTDTNATKATAADSSAGGTYGYATGKVPTASADAVRVKFTNQLLDYEHNKYLKVENTTDVVTNSRGEVLTGGEVKVFKSSVVIDTTAMAHESSNGYAYVNDQTPYIQEAMSVEFKPDTTNGYSYSDTLTISWWDSNEASSEGAAHHISISGFVYRDAAGIQHPYTGKLTKNADNSITSESEFAEFESVWSPLLGESTPFKHLTVLEGSVVVTLASAASEMPAKTLVQVEFNAPPKPAPAPSGGGSDNSSSSDSKAATAVAVVPYTHDRRNQVLFCTI